MNIETIRKKSKKIRIWFVISTILQILNSISIAIVLVASSMGLIENPLGSHSYLFVLLLAKMVISLTCITDLNKIIIGKYESMDEPSKLLHNINWACGLIIVLMVVMIIIAVCTQASSFAYAMGYTSLGTITFVIGSIMAFCLSSDISYEEKVKQYGSEAAYIDALITEKENKEIAKQQKENEQVKQKEQNTTMRLLEEVGTKFFVKYYEKLQNWSVPDLIDEIEERYSEESKINRIKKAKKIFELELNAVALEIISNSDTNAIDEDTRDRARQLLEQIKSTDE